MTRVAIVTGGASGIGAALCEALARRGDVVVCADLDADAARATADRISAAVPGRVEAVPLDVRDADAVAAVVHGTVSRHGRLDLMVNNAGIGVGGPAEDLTLAHWDRAIDVNVRGVVHGVAAAYPVMVAAGSGHIVNTASLAGLVPSPMLAPYAMSKHAVVGLSLSLRVEAAARGVRVSALCPGPTDTPILDSPGPADLPRGTGGMTARELLEQATGRPPYPAERLAADALRGVERNLALIVAPREARIAWWAQRLLPGAVEARGRRTVAWARARMAAAGVLASG